VVVFSTSQADKDVAESYRLHANCFVVKPVELDDFINAVHCIEHFWLERARLPGR
jgi:DNA-binding NarL/FixJ family response regulator